MENFKLSENEQVTEQDILLFGGESTRVSVADMWKAAQEYHGGATWWK